MELLISLRSLLIFSFMTVGLVSTLLWPFIGIILILSLTFLRAGFLFEWFPLLYETMHIVQFTIIFTLAAWMIQLNRYPLRINWDLIALFSFFGVICVSRTINGTDLLANKIISESLRVFLVVFLAAQLLRNARDMRKVLWTMVIIYLFLVLRAYWRYKTEYMDIALPDYFLVNRNGFANSLSMILPIAYFLARETKNKALKILGFSTVLWCIIGVILTYSRGGFLALAASMLLVFVHEKKKAPLVFIGLLLFIAIVPRLSEKYTLRLTTIETYEEDASAMGRVATNYAAINIFKQNPLLGIGAGNFNQVFLSYVPIEYLQWVEEGKSIHNILMQVISETGIIGFTFFCWIIIGAYRNTRLKSVAKDPESNNIAVMVRIALIAVFVGEQFGQGAYDGGIYMMLPFTIALKMNSIYQEQTQSISRRRVPVSGGLSYAK